MVSTRDVDLTRTGDPGANPIDRATRAVRAMFFGVDSHDNLFIVDSHNQRIRTVGVDGVTTTVFGGAAPPTQYSLASVAVDRAGNPLITKGMGARVMRWEGRGS